LSKRPIPGTCSAVRNAERAAPRSPIWPCTRWGFPCPLDYSRGGGLLPRLFTLTPPERGGLFSVALSVEPPRGNSPAHIPVAQVMRHRALWCSDFPPPVRTGSDSPPSQNHRQHTQSPKEDKPGLRGRNDLEGGLRVRPQASCGAQFVRQPAIRDWELNLRSDPDSGTPETPGFSHPRRDSCRRCNTKCVRSWCR